MTISQNEIERVSQLVTDVALIKQEIHFMREQLKSIQTIFRWFILAALTALATTIINFIVSGGLIT